MANFFQFQANYGKPAESPYVSQPVEKMGEAILESSKVNSLGNQALADVLNLKVDSLNVHKDELQNIKNQYNSEVNSLADELSKNPNKTTFQKIAELRKRVKSDLDATGRLGKIQNAYNQYASWQKDLDEETKKYNESGGTKGIDADTRNKKIQMLQYNLGNWYNEKGLTDQEIPLPKIVGYVDVENLAYDLAQKLPKMSYDDYTKWAQSNDLKVASPETFERTKTRTSTNLSRVGDNGEIIFDKNKLKDVVSNFLSNDPRVKTYLSDRADMDIFDSLSNDLLLNPDASKEIRNQYKQLYPQLRERIVNLKINDISDRSQKAFATKDKEFSTDRVENDLIKQKNKQQLEQIPFTSQEGATVSSTDWKKTLGITDPNEKISLKGYSPGTTGVGPIGTGIGVKTGQPINKEKNNYLEEVKVITQKALNLGLVVQNTDPNKKGKIDYEKTKNLLEQYGKNLSSFVTSTVDLSGTKVSENLTNTFFGEKSNLHNMTFMEQGNPDSKINLTIENKDKFRNSMVVGLDYTAESPGAVVLSVSDPDLKAKYGDKPYVAQLRNINFQDAMRPIQSLTKNSISYAKGENTKNSDMAKEAVKDMREEGINLNYGIPSAFAHDPLKKSDFISFHRVDENTLEPIITVVEITKDGEILNPKPLDKIQQENAAYIFTEVLPQYSRSEQSPKNYYK